MSQDYHGLDEYILSLKNYKGFAGDIVCHKVIQVQKPVFANKNFEQKPNISLLLKFLEIGRAHV